MSLFKGVGKGFQKLFSKFFGFEDGIDIADEIQLLNRKNTVIRNIIFVSNLFFTGVLFTIARFHPEQTLNWIFGFAMLPLTAAVNHYLKRIIKINPKDKLRQQVVMFSSSIYLLISTCVLYFRFITLRNESGVNFETAGYVLIFYSMVIISLYQNAALLTELFFLNLAMITIVHFFGTYFLETSHLSIQEFVQVFLSSEVFSDILLRTIIFVMFYLVLISIVSISQYIQKQRIKELEKRRKVQEDFTLIVQNTFKLLLSESANLTNQTQSQHVLKISRVFSQCFGFEEEDHVELNDFCLKISSYEEVQQKILNSNNMDYDELKEISTFAEKVATRFQIAKIADDISRLVAAEDFKAINDIQILNKDMIHQIVLVSEIYINLRKSKNYGRPYNHQLTKEVMEKLPSTIILVENQLRFQQFHQAFDKEYSTF